MSKKYEMSRYFGNGSGRAIILKGSDTVLFSWNGKSDGVADRMFPGQRITPWVRKGIEHPNFASLLRAVVKEHEEEN